MSEPCLPNSPSPAAIAGGISSNAPATRKFLGAMRFRLGANLPNDTMNWLNRALLAKDHKKISAEVLLYVIAFYYVMT